MSDNNIGKILSVLLTPVTLLFSFGCGSENEETVEPPQSDDDTSGDDDQNNDQPLQEDIYGTGNIIGGIDWVDATTLTGQRALNATASGEITFNLGGETGYRCSATIISKDMIITNHHCAPDRNTASTVRYYPTTESTVPVRERVLDSFSCGALVATNCSYDVSILRCLPHPDTGLLPGEAYGSVEMELEEEFETNEQVYMLHTNCDYRDDDCIENKLLSPGTITSYGGDCINFGGEGLCGNCRTDAPQAHHTCDSLGGSSGGGIFANMTDKLLGLNWGSIRRPNDEGGYNNATSLASFVKNVPLFDEILSPLVTCTDDDGDGYGREPTRSCADPLADCNDADPNIKPSAIELCDNIDSDCNGIIDDGLSQICGSNTGECTTGVEACSFGTWGDCEGDIEPATEICNNQDDDCDGTIDNDVVSSESYVCPDKGICERAAEICESGGWQCVYPDGFVEDECPVVDTTCGFGSLDDPLCSDRLDNDCDGAVDEHDQYAECAELPAFHLIRSGENCFVSTAGECGRHGGEYKCVQLADTCGVDIDCVGAEFPQSEICDGLDHNCNGYIDDRNDDDGDGFGTCPSRIDCDETRRDINPEGIEVCDGLDNNCNEMIDEGSLCDDMDICTEDICTGAGECFHTNFCWEDTTSGTGLTWQDPPSENIYSWENAKNYCEALTVGGISDWRLPSISELRSIVRACGSAELGGACRVTETCSSESSCSGLDCGGCSTTAGPGVNGAYWDVSLTGRLDGSYHGGYWSSTPVDEYAEEGVYWSVGFSRGSVTYGNSYTDEAFVRCVTND